MIRTSPLHNIGQAILKEIIHINFKPPLFTSHSVNRRQDASLAVTSTTTTNSMASSNSFPG